MREQLTGANKPASKANKTHAHRPVPTMEQQFKAGWCETCLEDGLGRQHMAIHLISTPFSWHGCNLTDALLSAGVSRALSTPRMMSAFLQYLTPKDRLQLADAGVSVSVTPQWPPKAADAMRAHGPPGHQSPELARGPPANAERRSSAHALVSLSEEPPDQVDDLGSHAPKHATPNRYQIRKVGY